MGGYHTKENSSNENLRWRSIVTKDTNDPKGWPHPEGRQRRRNTVEGSPLNLPREEESRVKDQHRPCKQAEHEKHRKRREGLKPNPRHQGSRRTDTRWPENPKGTCSWESCASCRPWERARHMGENQVKQQRPLQPNPRSKPANWSQTCWRTRQGCRTPKGKQWKGELRWHKVENQVGYQDICTETPQLHAKPPLQE